MVLTVEQLGEVVVAGLRSAGYQESTIDQYEKTVRCLGRFLTDRGECFYTPLVGAEFAARTTARTGRFSAQRRFAYRRLVTLFDGYLATGVVDLSVRGRGGGGRAPQTAAFRELDEAWRADIEDRGLAPATQTAYGQAARAYLVFLESRGVQAWEAADGASVAAFLESLSARWSPSSLYSLVSNFRPFLRSRAAPTWLRRWAWPG